MTLNRAQLLRRALVGATVITFGELPDRLAELPGAAPAPAAAARTAVPTAARLIPSGMLSDGTVVVHPDEYNRLVALGVTPREAENVTALTVQRVKWLSDNKATRWPQPVLGGRETLAVLPPQGGRFFQADDIVRANGTGDCYLVGKKRPKPDVLALTYVGVTGHNVPIIDEREEAAALYELLPLREPDEPVEEKIRRHQHEAFGRPLPLVRNDIHVGRLPAEGV